MPLNEAAGLRRSSLTREQRREAEQAIYGRPPQLIDDVMNITPDELERMRAIIAQADSTRKIEAFDINNPPQKPYFYQPFPKTIYHHGKRVNTTVHNEEQLEQHLADGWDRQPFPADAPAEPVLDASSAAEAAQLDQQLERLRKKK